MIEGYMSVEEAAIYLKCTKRSIRGLCTSGKLHGARKFGARVWAIPEQSVKNYQKGLQGFALDKARRDAQREAKRNEINAAIRQGKLVAQERKVNGHDQ